LYGIRARNLQREMIIIMMNTTLENKKARLAYEAGRVAYEKAEEARLAYEKARVVYWEAYADYNARLADVIDGN
jgi:hypothetical protein